MYTIIRTELKHKLEKCAIFLFMLHNCITIHGKTNIKVKILSIIFNILIILMMRVVYMTNRKRHSAERLIVQYAN